MIKRYLGFFGIGILALASWFGIVGTRHVQAANATEVGLVVSPPLSEITINPGETKGGVIKVSNPTGQDLKVDVSINNFSARGETGEQSFSDASEGGTFALAKWLSAEGGLVVKSGETIESNYIISVPKDAEPGGHYGVVFFSASPLSTVDANANAAIYPKVGSLFIVQVPGNLRYGASLLDFGLNTQVFTNRNITATFAARVQNSGNVHIKPTGDIKIKNITGQEVATLKVNEQAGNVLPDSIRKFESTWDKKNGFGRYSAVLNLAYGENGTLTKSITFWIIPWKESAGVLVLLGIVIYLARHIQWKKGDEKENKNKK